MPTDTPATTSGTPSLLDRMIARLTVQRSALDWAAAALAGRDGLVLEIGLGKGRTYDHLRYLFPQDGVLAFDRDLHAPAAYAPQPDRLRLGDFRETLAQAHRELGVCARLAHADFGSPDRDHDARQADWLAPLIDALMQPNGIVLSDRPLTMPRWQPVPLEGTEAWPYYAWRVGPN